MARRRAPAPRPVRSQVGPSRRMDVRRTPQDSVRVAAAWVVERTLASLAPVDSFLATVTARFDERDQGLLQELVYGTLRWLRRLDHVLETASSRRLDQIEEVLHAPLRIAAYQLLFLDRVPAHAAVNEAVEEAHRRAHRGAASFVNAVLRRIARSPELDAWPVEEREKHRRLAIEYSHPDFLVGRWLERWGGERTVSLLRANNRSKPMQLLAFRHRGGRELLAEELIDGGLGVEPSVLSPLGLTVRHGNPLKTEAFAQGKFYVQDEVSQVAALLLRPKPGERILDAAAAPGGKGFALYACEPEIRLTLADVSIPRLDTLRANLRRLDLRIPTLLADAGALPFAPVFDRVVLDLPCTGTGTLRKNPEIKWRLSSSEVGRLASSAARLLTGGAARVAPGGVLMAITCSLEAEENETVVEAFLAQRRDFAPVALEEVVPTALATRVEAPGRWRVFPGDDHDGFTVHVLRRDGRET